jgi:RNA polymerase-binding transcription factor DksA
MAKFLTGNELNSELEKILEGAEEQIILISPYIKLHDRYASTLRTKLNNHKLEITIVFGKNEDDMSRSMKQDDFNFFKEFPNIQIRYEKRLHAKYYASESAAILTSMNLYSYSQDNNIEAGVLTKVTLLGDLASSFMTNDTFDNQAWNYFGRVIEQSELLFQKTPQYESAMMGLTKNYKESKVEIDKLSEFFADRAKFESGNRKDTYEKKKVESTPQTQTKSIETGYCIRTGKQIPFNQKRPLSDEAYQSWAKFSKEDYPEKFCHFSGEPSNGETTFAKPILRKHWKKAKETFNL